MTPDFQGVPLDRSTIPQDRLDIDHKVRSNPFPWNGQFSPQLIETLLRAYAPVGSYVLDPFVGSGTVLYESGRLGHSAFGSEVNPAAIKMAQVYRFINVDRDERLKLIAEADHAICGSLPDASLFSVRKGRGSIQGALSEAANVAEPILVKSLLDALVVLLNYGEEPLKSVDVFHNWKRLRNTVIGLPISVSPIDVENCDARAIPLASSSVDFVVTSPPYINVFNYHQHYRRSVESLGWNPLEVARSEIGSNRKHRQNRYLTVIQYCLDMAAMFKELRRVCRPTARVIIVIGRESNVRKTSFSNSEIVARLAVRCCGYSFDARQERVFQNRFGANIREDILHFSISETSAVPPAEIALQTLNEALARAPKESLSDLHDACSRVGDIRPSPLFAQTSAQQASRRRRETV